MTDTPGYIHSIIMTADGVSSTMTFLCDTETEIGILVAALNRCPSLRILRYHTNFIPDESIPVEPQETA